MVELDGGLIFLGIVLWCFLWGVLNCVFATFKYGIKIPKNKKWKEKKSPIYELYYCNWQGYYSIKKWRLEWYCYDSWLLAVIPFFGIFRFYGYVEQQENYGSFDKSQIEGLEDLKFEYEKRYEQALLEVEKWRKETNEFQTKQNRLNKEFKENYE